MKSLRNEKPSVKQEGIPELKKDSAALLDERKSASSQGWFLSVSPAYSSEGIRSYHRPKEFNETLSL
jgi:hypothetical protein